MTTFLLDLWQDLRAKRLWPVAAALVIATVAIPAVLSKPPASPPQTNGTGADAGGSKLPTVALDASSVDGSHLDVFGQKNPFAAGSDKVVATTSTGSTSTSTSSSTSVGSSVATAGSTASAATPTSSSTTSASTTSGSTSGSTSSSTGGKTSSGAHYFTYTVDVRFGKHGSMKTYKSVGELELLPNGKNPIVSFMGVKNGDTAMFFVAGAGFKADGEGHCQPTRDNCMFVFLKTNASHNEETLSAPGGQVEYTLKLTGLHTKSLTAEEAKGTTTPDESKSAKARKAAELRAKERATLLAMPALGVTR